MDIANRYDAKTNVLNDTGENIGARRRIMGELIVQYSITELEAINIYRCEKYW